MPGQAHWADILTLREEVASAEGRIGDLQMSLYSAVYADRVVPYRDPGYYSEITEPTPGLISFMATIARLSPEVDPDTRSLVVDCTVPNDDLELRPGMFAIASIRE